jgi:hypothetical protein
MKRQPGASGTKYVLLNADAVARRDELRPMSCGNWTQIGGWFVVWSDDDDWAEVRAALGRSGARVPAAKLAPGRLYYVIQVGAAFQTANPDVPVALDRGRHLVVALPAGAEEPPDGPDWRVRPLPANEAIVGTVDAAAARQAPVPWIRSLVAAVSRPAIEGTIQHLASMPTRHSLSSHYAAAADWVCAQLVAMGYAAAIEEFSMPGGICGNVTADSPQTGAAGARGLVLVTAHLDSVNVAGGPSAPAPGADDNASGAAGLLEIARVLAGQRQRHDLRLILFGGEEQGLLGSQHYVDGLPASERSRIIGVVNMDMVAVRNTTNPTVLLEGAAVSKGQIAELAAAASTYTGLTVHTSLNPFASDHVPFINAGLPALLTIEGADSANTAIHTANDTVDRLDLDLAAEIVRMNVAAVASIVGRDSDWLTPVLHTMMA